MKLLPVKQHLHQNKRFTDNPYCRDSIFMSVDFFNRVGYHPPWIGYYMQIGKELVGGGAFKGKPQNGKVEIAYMVFPQYRHQGIGSRIANALVQLSLKTDPAVIITAKTLPEENFSAKILRRNNFKLEDTVIDEEDGEVWEWVYEPHPINAIESKI